jgi:hypothetical protein
MFKRLLHFVGILIDNKKQKSASAEEGFYQARAILLNSTAIIISLFLMVMPQEVKKAGKAFMSPKENVAAMGGYPDYPNNQRTAPPPMVAITVPADGSVYAAPANIMIFAGAVDYKAGVAKVDFYQNSIFLYEAQYQPYSYTWRNVPDGNYIITASATNNAGVTGSSVPIYIKVINPTAAGCTCAGGCSERTNIAPPFTIDGMGRYCYEATSLGNYVSSWNLDTLEINGVSLKNCWTNNFPHAINGKYFIYYECRNPFGHLEMR